jgi:outer membrane lipoprotein-sorting protein
MNEKIITKVFSLLLAIAEICWAGVGTGSLASSEAERADANSVVKPQVEVVLERLKKQTAGLKSYQSQIEYKFSQPLLESETLKKGVLYYQRSDGKLAGAKPGEARSVLRINFQSLKQDEEEEQKYIEQYIFDGVWLTHIDYQIKEVKRYQRAEPNEPVDAFELVSENFPIIGFSKVEDLKKEFEIGLVDSTHSASSGQASSPQVEQQGGQAKNFIQLHLKVKADSVYKNDYTSIDFWIDKQLYLPAKIVAVSTEEDIYEIKFLKPKINEKVDKKVFELKIPDGFNVETEPLKKSQEESQNR